MKRAQVFTHEAPPPPTPGRSCPSTGVDPEREMGDEGGSTSPRAVGGAIEARVLVLFTGGTIGMKKNAKGEYEPVPMFLSDELRKSPRFNDIEYAADRFSEEEEDIFVLPPADKGMRILFKFIEYSPLLDSSNMSSKNWVKIAEDIKKFYDEVDGFVILHGTDTMAYTASALSFMCQDLGKPILITGSQIPMVELRSDGYDNFIASLTVAAMFCIPEVLICFNSKVFRGNRCVKINNTAFGAFMSPNLPPLVTLGIDISVNWTTIFTPRPERTFSIHTKMCPNVAVLLFFPGISSETVQAFLQPPIKGVVLTTFGAGNIPSNQSDLVEILCKATQQGLIIVNVTQCLMGYVSSIYATSEGLSRAGIIPGGDMTPQAAVTKLSYVLGKDKWSLEKKRLIMSLNIRGEKSEVDAEKTLMTSLDLIETMAAMPNQTNKEEVKSLCSAVFPNLMCVAAKDGDINVLKKLKAMGGNPSTANQDGRTPLHVACSKGHLSTVEHLLHVGASVQMLDQHGYSPLRDAIQGHYLDIIQLLVKMGASAGQDHMKIATSLCSAAAQGDLEAIKVWCAAGVDLNIQDYDKRTPLHVAVCAGSKSTAEFLIKHGAKTDIEDIFGNTARIHARNLGLNDLLFLMEELNVAE